MCVGKVEFAEGKRSFPHRPVTALRRPADVPGIDPRPIGDIGTLPIILHVTNKMQDLHLLAQCNYGQHA